MRYFEEPAGLVRGHAYQIDRHVSASTIQDVRAETSASAGQMVDHCDSPRDFTGVLHVARDRDAMLDDPNVRVARVPHQRVKWRHVNKDSLWIVGHNVARIGWMLPRRVVLKVDAGQSTLLRGEECVLVAQIVIGRLKENAVELLARNVITRHFVDIGWPWERPTDSAVARAPVGVHGNIDLVPDVREVVEITPMHLPCEHA